MEIAQEQQNNSKVPPQLREWQYKKGQSGNPAGRPKGQSLKEYARNKLLTMTDDEKEEFFNGLNKDTIWEMAEGRPEAVTKTDITTMGEKLPSTDLDKLAEAMTSKLKEEKI